MITCGCRCIACKSQQLESHSFAAPDGYDDIHHTCRSCGTHFNHLDGETYAKCETCRFPGNMPAQNRHFKFLTTSRYFYVSLVIAFAGAQVDWVLTAIGLVLGYSETRPLFWLHAVALFAVIFTMYALFYEKRPKLTNYLCLAFAVTSPAVPIISNVMVLTTGRPLFP